MVNLFNSNKHNSKESLQKKNKTKKDLKNTLKESATIPIFRHLVKHPENSTKLINFI